MTSRKEKEDRVRRLLDASPHPAVPAGLPVRAVERGTRLQRRRRNLRVLGWLLLAALALALVVWVAVEQPWQSPPSDIAPPVEGL
ncbi:hypothetical protein GCM10020367_40270 [Streptomyces sannanensis]|uniref:Uncharacterized protein n=1 Tax=Streptomyces sannanensis TaxID=285536 RepID=A0ABP6SEY3_9ACTN